MTSALRARLFPTAPVEEAPVEEKSLVTYAPVDPYAWMTEAERAYHTHGGVTR